MISGLNIEYAVNGANDELALERLSVAFERAGNELADFEKYIFPRLTPVFEAEMARQFDAEGDGPSGAWAPLSPGYADWKDRAFPGNPILVLTGKLKAALTDSSNPFASRAISGNEFNFGTQGIDYASFHQTGTDTMDARPPFDFSADFEGDLARESLAAAREAVADSGLGEFVEVVD